MCATTIAVMVDSRATAYSRIMQWLHRIGEAIDSLVAWWRHSLTGRVIDRYVSRRGPLLANGLAMGYCSRSSPAYGSWSARSDWW